MVDRAIGRCIVALKTCLYRVNDVIQGVRASGL